MLNRTVATLSRLTTTALSVRSIVSEELRAVEGKLMATLAPANVMVRRHADNVFVNAAVVIHNATMCINREVNAVTVISSNKPMLLAAHRAACRRGATREAALSSTRSACQAPQGKRNSPYSGIQWCCWLRYLQVCFSVWAFGAPPEVPVVITFLLSIVYPPKSRVSAVQKPTVTIHVHAVRRRARSRPAASTLSAPV